MNPDGTVNRAGSCCGYTAETAPVLFETNAAGYMQMPHKWLGGPRCDGEKYVKRGMIYVTAGCRGRESHNEAGEPVGKAPVTLIDTKMAVRFLRHNRAALPGDWDRMISCGVSAGGAMSTLLGVTGDHPDYDDYLREAGAFMDESDAMFASQIYCPIIDLEHADLAYEWCFGADAECEDSPAGPAETMTPFKAALSKQLAARYIDYVNGLNLKHPVTGAALRMNPDGRSGGFYDYLMEMLGESAAKFLKCHEHSALGNLSFFRALLNRVLKASHSSQGGSFGQIPGREALWKGCAEWNVKVFHPGQHLIKTFDIFKPFHKHGDLAASVEHLQNILNRERNPLAHGTSVSRVFFPPCVGIYKHNNAAQRHAFSVVAKQAQKFLPEGVVKAGRGQAEKDKGREKVPDKGRRDGTQIFAERIKEGRGFFCLIKHKEPWLTEFLTFLVAERLRFERLKTVSPCLADGVRGLGRGMHGDSRVVFLDIEAQTP